MPTHTPKKKTYAYHLDTRLPPAIVQPTIRLLQESQALPCPPKHENGKKTKQADVDCLTGLVEPVREKWLSLTKRVKAQLGNGTLCGISAMIWESALWSDPDYLRYKRVQSWTHQQTPEYKAYKKVYDARRKGLQKEGLWEADMVYRELDEARLAYCDAVYLKYSEDDLGLLAQTLWDLAHIAERLGPYCVACGARECAERRGLGRGLSREQFLKLPHPAYELAFGSVPAPGPLGDSVAWFTRVVLCAVRNRRERDRLTGGLSDAAFAACLRKNAVHWAEVDEGPLCEPPDERGCLIPDDDDEDQAA